MDNSLPLKSQAILDCDDFEMDDILTEFAEEENKNSVIQLSDSEDELDSLVAEFASAQSESDDGRKKSEVKVILSSDDDEIDELLEEFEDDNSTKCTIVSKDVVTSDLNNSQLKNKSIIFCEKDTKNGMCYDTSMEIEENAESFDDVQGSEDSLRENTDVCQSESVQDIHISNVNVSESHLKTADLSNKHVISDDYKLKSVANEKALDNKMSSSLDTSEYPNDKIIVVKNTSKNECIHYDEIESKFTVSTQDKNSANSTPFCDTNTSQVDTNNRIPCSDLVDWNQNELDTKEISNKNSILQIILESSKCNEKVNCSKTSSGENSKIFNNPSSSGMAEIKVLNISSLHDTDNCNITNIPTSKTDNENDMNIDCVSEKIRFNISNGNQNKLDTKETSNKNSVLQIVLEPSKCIEKVNCNKTSNVENLKTFNTPSSNGVEEIKVLNVSSLHDTDNFNITSVPISKIDIQNDIDIDCVSEKTRFNIPNEHNSSFITSTAISVETSDIIEASICKFLSINEENSPSTQENINNLKEDFLQCNNDSNSDNILTEIERKSILSEEKTSSTNEDIAAFEMYDTSHKRIPDSEINVEKENCLTLENQSKESEMEMIKKCKFAGKSPDFSKITFKKNESDSKDECKEDECNSVTSTDSSSFISSDNLSELSFHLNEKLVNSNSNTKVCSRIEGSLPDSTENTQLKNENIDSFNHHKYKSMSIETRKHKLECETETTRKKKREASHESMISVKNKITSSSRNKIKEIIPWNPLEKICVSNKVLDKVAAYILRKVIDQNFHDQVSEAESTIKQLEENKKKLTEKIEYYRSMHEESHSSLKALYNEKSYKEVSTRDRGINVKTVYYVQNGSHAPSLPTATNNCTLSSGQTVVPSPVNATSTSKILLDSSNKLQNQKNEVRHNGILKETDKPKVSTMQFPIDSNVLLPFTKFLQLLPSRTKDSTPPPPQAVFPSLLPAPSNEKKIGMSVRPQGPTIPARTVFVASPGPKSTKLPNHHASPGIIQTISVPGIHEKVTGATSKPVAVYHSKANGQPLQQVPAVSVNYNAQSLNKPVVTVSSFVQPSYIRSFQINHNIQNINRFTLSGSNAAVVHHLRQPYRPPGPQIAGYNPVTTSVSTNSSLKPIYASSNFHTTSSATSLPQHASSVCKIPLYLNSSNTNTNSESSQIRPVNSAGNSSQEGLVSSKQTITSSSSITETKQNNSGHRILIPAFPENSPNSKNPGMTSLPKPELKVKVKDNSKTVMLSWNLLVNHLSIDKYQIFSCHTTTKGPAVWKNIGNIKAMPLPMACTLQQFDDKNSYHFIVRAADGSGNVGPFSNLVSVNF